jgi:hypothetical protein
MENFQENLKKISNKIIKLIRIGLIISLVTMVLSIPYSLIKSGSAFTYLLTWLYIIATVITVFALLSTMTPGIAVISDATSSHHTAKTEHKDKDKDDDEGQTTLDDRVKKMMKKREESWTFAFEVGGVGVIIYILATIIDVIERAM